MPAKGKGGYYEPWPVDFMLLELMPDDGLLAGVHWRGRQAKDLLAEMDDHLPIEARVSVHVVQSRLRSLHVAGYVTNHPGSGGKRIWARTAKGVEFLGRKNEVLGIEEKVDAPVEVEDWDGDWGTQGGES